MFDGKRPFTRTDAIEAGISPKLLRGSRFRRIFRDVYIASEVPDGLRLRISAALALHPPGAWASHLSAAAVCGVAVPDTSVVHISVTDAKSRRWRPGLKPHVAPPHTKPRTWRGVPVSGPIRMFVELASILDLVDLVVAGDSMLKVFRLTADQLRAGLDATRDYWSPAARNAARFVRDGVDSPMETRLRMLIVLAGLPEPTVNFKLRDENGDVIVRFDLSYPALRLIIEYDGRQHVEIIENWEGDNERRELLDELEWRVIKVRSHGVFVDPGATVERVWRALRDRGAAVRVPTENWRRHFPGRAYA
jgi:very-short-patch-repair endonuclease